MIFSSLLCISAFIISISHAIIEKENFNYEQVISVVISIFSFLVMVFAVCLLAFHVYLLKTGMTTNEKIKNL